MGESRFEAALLRRELRRAWDLVEILLDLMASSLRTAGKELLALAEEVFALRRRTQA